MLADRYDLSDRPAKGVTMARGKPVQEGIRVKLPAGMTWEKLAAMTPEEIKEKGLWPAGFLPLPQPAPRSGRHDLPQMLIDETKKQTDRDLTPLRPRPRLRQVPILLPEFPAPIYLTTRPDLGDVSKNHS